MDVGCWKKASNSSCCDGTGSEKSIKSASSASSTSSSSSFRAVCVKIRVLMFQ